MDGDIVDVHDVHAWLLSPNTQDAGPCTMCPSVDL